MAKFTGVVFVIATAFGWSLVAHAADPIAAKDRAAAPVTRHEFFVSPAGSDAGDGSAGNPWSLQAALSHPPQVRPGDTIWVRGGTYSGTFTSNLNGTPAAPILVRQVAGERATLDGGNSNGNAVLVASGSYTWFWGFEVTSSDATRSTTDTGSWPSGTSLPRGEGILVDQSSPHPGLKFVNLVIHDTRQGISFWKEAVDGEIYGCLIFNNGWEAADRGHGHGIYLQNQTGVKLIADNIIFSGFSHGIHGYGSSNAFLNNIRLVGNTLFNAGDLSADGGRNLLLGGGAVVRSPVLDSNDFYRLPGKRGSDLKLNYGGGCTDPILTNNFVADSVDISCTSMTASGNSFLESPGGVARAQFPDNTYVSSRPSGSSVFVRPNQYESGRANVTTYNWDLASTVNVDLSSVLSPGDGYEVHNAQNVFASPVVAGTYGGGTVPFPMVNLSTASPVAWPGQPPTGPEFNVFIVLRTKIARQEIQRAPRPAQPEPTPRRVRRPDPTPTQRRARLS